jgi:small GTP-binding protein
MSQIVEVDGKRIKLQIWDTAGQDRFKNITQTYYKGASGIILTFSFDDKESLKNIDSWMRSIEDNSSEHICKMIIGNKMDIPDKYVTTEEGQ